MPLEAFISFALVDVLLVLTPGADWAFAIAVGVKGDRVTPAISGLATGYLAHLAYPFTASARPPGAPTALLHETGK